MASISLHEAQILLAEIIHSLPPGEEVVITENDLPVARLIAPTVVAHGLRRPGMMKGTVLYMAPDFNEPLEDFKEIGR